MNATAGFRGCWAWTYWTFLAALLATGLYMRVANLDEIQHFEGDQGGDYIEVMKWLKDRGPWPLLGQIRSVGDRGLGPGWFYTIAPAMALTDYHPAAGAATIAVMSALTIFLCADWVRRATTSRAAALVTAGVFALSARWTDAGRTLWDPNTLPFAVAALAWLIALLPRRPVPCMAVALALVAILPQWHTLGLLVDVTVLGPLALAWRAARPAMATTPRRTWVLWEASCSSPSRCSTCRR